MSQNVSLSAKQLAAIDALMQSSTVISAAESVGISRRQMHRWLSDSVFISALDDAKRESVRHATRRLSGALSSAISTTIYLAIKGEDEGVRLRAAMAVPTMLREMAAHGELEERIAALEAKAKA